MSKIMIALAIGALSGDTLSVRLGSEVYRVKIADIQAPAYGERYSIDAEQELARLCYQKNTTIKYEDVQAGKLIIGKVSCNRQDAATEMVRSGWVKVTNPENRDLNAEWAKTKERRVGVYR